MRRMYSKSQIENIASGVVEDNALHLYAVTKEFLDGDDVIGELEIKILTNKELVAGEIVIDDLDNIVNLEFYNITGEGSDVFNYPLYYEVTETGIHVDTLINDTTAGTFEKGTITISLTNINTYDLVKIF